MTNLARRFQVRHFIVYTKFRIAITSLYAIFYHGRALSFVHGSFEIQNLYVGEHIAAQRLFYACFRI